MRILFFVSSMHSGGAERVAATLANAWSQRGDLVTLVPTFRGRGTCFYPVSADVDLVWLADRYSSRRGGSLVGTVRKWRALRRLVREKQPDVIISFLTNVNVMVLLSTYRMGIATVVCERTHPALSTNIGGVLKGLRRLTYPWADLVTVQTQASIAPIREKAPAIRALRVVPNPLPPELFDVAPAAGGPDVRGRYHLMAMGRLVEAKQFDQLIAAFLKLAPHFPEWDLVIWGDGPQHETLARQVRDAGMESRIALPGRTEVPWTELANANAFALTSAVEGFPNVLLEAMALGLPCIAYDCPSGPREITRDGSDALLVAPGDQTALMHGLRDLMSDAGLRQDLGCRAAQSVRQRFALPEVLKTWDALMEQAMASARDGKMR